MIERLRQPLENVDCLQHFPQFLVYNMTQAFVSIIHFPKKKNMDKLQNNHADCSWCLD